ARSWQSPVWAAGGSRPRAALLRATTEPATDGNGHDAPTFPLCERQSNGRGGRWKDRGGAESLVHGLSPWGPPLLARVRVDRHSRWRQVAGRGGVAGRTRVS